MHKTINVSAQLNSFLPLIEGICKTEEEKQEGVNAMLKSISLYTSSQQCKLSWFITMTVRNRIVDLRRKASRVPTVKKYGPLDESAPLDLELDRVTTFNPFMCIEFNKLCEDILSEEQHQLLKEYYVYGHTPSDILKNSKNNIEMIKPSSVIRKDIESCLNLIAQKLKSTEENRIMPD